jgi:hypothetical protein
MSGCCCATARRASVSSRPSAARSAPGATERSGAALSRERLNSAAYRRLKCVIIYWMYDDLLGGKDNFAEDPGSR